MKAVVNMSTFCDRQQQTFLISLNTISDEQELKVFVDLAMISAGEEDMEIDRISYMHTSCLGFGSLIFGYRPEHGFIDLMQLCEPLWQALDANQSIGEKLVSYCFHVLV